METKLDHFLVCGLGSLGQHCVLCLKEFGVKVTAIEQIRLPAWEIPSLSGLLDDLIIGDCRQVDILERAKITRCRAALLVTTQEQVNIETALTIRQLNPQTRIVIRSAKDNLNELLSEQLGNFIAYEPTQLPVTTFALAALTADILSLFTIDGERFRVIQYETQNGDRWSNTRVLYELNNRNRRLIAHITPNSPHSQKFYEWEPSTIIRPQETLIYIETVEQITAKIMTMSEQVSTTQSPRKHFNYIQSLRQRLHQWWQVNNQYPVRKVAFACGLILCLLLLSGTFLLRLSYPGTTLLSAFSATMILLLGGYSDLFGEFEQMDKVPPWLQLYSLGLSLAGTAFVGVLYALVTEALLSAKFQFLNRPPVPQKDHIIVIGLGRVGQRIASLLQELKQSIVGVTLNNDFDRTILPKIPLIVGNLKEALPKSNLATAKSVVIVTNDEILNLEVALMSQKINPQSRLVIRALGEQLSKSISQLLPNAQIIAAYAVAAEVFAAAAFGENIITVFRWQQKTILVTEYEIEETDTLHGLLLADIAYGYGAMPILHQKPLNSPITMPSDDVCLASGDRLVVLATIEGLCCIEQGQLNTSLKRWFVTIEKAVTSDAKFEGANIIARIAGCPLHVARDLMKDLPHTLETPLYQHQAIRLVRALSKIQVSARLINC